MGAARAILSGILPYGTTAQMVAAAHCRGDPVSVAGRAALADDAHAPERNLFWLYEASSPSSALDFAMHLNIPLR
jgi:hypothetical protein